MRASVELLRILFGYVGLFASAGAFLALLVYYTDSDNPNDLLIGVICLSTALVALVGFAWTVQKKRQFLQRQTARPAGVLIVQERQAVPDSPPAPPSSRPAGRNAVLWIALALVAGFVALGLILRL